MCVYVQMSYIYPMVQMLKVCICSDKNVVIQQTSFYVSTFKSLDEPKEMIECS